ncbi:predicted protein [Plenodomus lingam JN3]|uniref:Predicted protein n=1 Tax=Leptosphaeria maculans (strain JN3 / isolate v23.1.3 / race Av1-4-5-6-7-8) TaxID=985895 RepID=E5R4U1_LEPMJ|nr:predicted protein [Plenodomus lingam JN3]CBX92214.1 predicted protein [Plenodomus lingam JN3]
MLNEDLPTVVDLPKSGERRDAKEDEGQWQIVSALYPYATTSPLLPSHPHIVSVVHWRYHGIKPEQI